MSVEATLYIEATSFHYWKIIAKEIGNRFSPKDMSPIFLIEKCRKRSVPKEMTHVYKHQDHEMPDLPSSDVPIILVRKRKVFKLS